MLLVEALLPAVVHQKRPLFHLVPHRQGGQGRQAWNASQNVRSPPVDVGHIRKVLGVGAQSGKRELDKGFLFRLCRKGVAFPLLGYCAGDSGTRRGEAEQNEPPPWVGYI